MVDEMTNSRPIIKPAQQKPILITNSPAFETLVLGKSTGTIGSQTLRGNSERWKGVYNGAGRRKNVLGRYLTITKPRFSPVLSAKCISHSLMAGLRFKGTLDSLFLPL